jgi:phosphotriesterase-related protein
MTTVNTVLGPINTADLGFTLMHEHIVSGTGGLYAEYPELFGSRAMEHIISALIKAKEGGIDTIVDASTFDLGRDIHVLAEASRRSGINIICATGWWTDIPHDFSNVSSSQLASLFVRDIEKGIAGTGVRAGIIKAASDKDGVTPEQKTILQGVARAHLETGAPIMLHSYAPGQVGRQQLSVLKAEGVKLDRVKLDHSNDTADTEYLMWVLDQGTYLGMDRYPGPKSVSVSTQGRNKVLKVLIDAGYADRLLLSHDWILTPIAGDTPLYPFMAEIRLENPYDLLFIKKVVLPDLVRLGVPETVANSLCVNGPRYYFENKILN